MWRNWTTRYAYTFIFVRKEMVAEIEGVKP